MSEDSCVYSGVPAEAVTIAVLNYKSFDSLCCLINKKTDTLNLLNKQLQN